MKNFVSKLFLNILTSFKKVWEVMLSSNNTSKSNWFFEKVKIFIRENKSVSDGVYAELRGLSSLEWKSFLSVILKNLSNLLPESFYKSLNYNKRVFIRKVLFINKNISNKITYLTVSYAILILIINENKKFFKAVFIEINPIVIEVLYPNWKIFVEKMFFIFNKIKSRVNNFINSYEFLALLVDEDRRFFNNQFNPTAKILFEKSKIFFKQKIEEIYILENNLEKIGGKSYYIFFFIFKYTYIIVSTFFYYAKNMYLYIFLTMVVAYIFLLSTGSLLSLAVVFIFSFIIRKFGVNRISFTTSTELEDLPFLQKFINNSELNKRFLKENSNEILISIVLYDVFTKKFVHYSLVYKK